jgi:hypothetical protein
MFHRHPGIAAVITFVAGVFLSQSLTGYTQETSPVTNDTSVRVIKAPRRKAEITKYVRDKSYRKTSTVVGR